MSVVCVCVCVCVCACVRACVCVCVELSDAANTPASSHSQNSTHYILFKDNQAY